MSKDFEVYDYLDTNLLLERFLSDCQAISEEIDGDSSSFTYVADTIAAVYYHREYDGSEDFITDNKDYIDEERAEWVRYMWKTLDSMDISQRSNIIIESLNQLSAVADY